MLLLSYYHQSCRLVRPNITGPPWSSSLQTRLGPPLPARPYPVLGQVLGRDAPGGVAHHLVHVAAVADGVVALVLVHHREALELVGQVVAAHCGPGGGGGALTLTLAQQRYRW